MTVRKIRPGQDIIDIGSTDNDQAGTTDRDDPTAFVTSFNDAQASVQGTVLLRHAFFRFERPVALATMIYFDHVPSLGLTTINAAAAFTHELILEGITDVGLDLDAVNFANMGSLTFITLADPFMKVVAKTNTVSTFSSPSQLKRIKAGSFQPSTQITGLRVSVKNPGSYKDNTGISQDDDTMSWSIPLSGQVNPAVRALTLGGLEGFSQELKL